MISVKRLWVQVPSELCGLDCIVQSSITVKTNHCCQKRGWRSSGNVGRRMTGMRCAWVFGGGGGGRVVSRPGRGLQG